VCDATSVALDGRVPTLSYRHCSHSGPRRSMIFDGAKTVFDTHVWHPSALGREGV
jgi:hypothetical protein